MKVQFVTANYPPEAGGGTEQVVVALAQALQADGVEVRVACASDRPFDGAASELGEHDGVVVERYFRKADEHDRDGFVRPRLLRLIEGRLANWRPDVVHVHSFAGLGFGLAALAKAIGAPMVTTFHDQWITCARYFRLPRGGVSCPSDADHAACTTCVLDALVSTDADFVSRGLDERFRLARAELAGVAACTAPSRAAADTVRRCLPFDASIEVVPHGLLRAIPAAHRAAPPAPGERLRVGTFGGLVPEKGVVELVEACAALVGTVDLELHLSGRFYDPAVERDLRERAASKRLPLVVRGPFTSADRHPARDLHLAVFPSKCEETYGLVIDEALGHGVPVLCSDRGAFAERAATPGVRATPLAELVNGLREVVGSAERLAAQRAAIAATLPTIAASARRHLDLYRSLAPSA